MEREAPETYFPNLGSNAGVLIRKDILDEKQRSRSPSPNKQRESDMSIGMSLNPNLKKAKEDRIKYQRHFLNGEEGSSGSEGEGEEGKEKTKSKTVVMHFKRKAKDKGEYGDINMMRKRRAGRAGNLNNYESSDDLS